MRQPGAKGGGGRKLNPMNAIKVGVGLLTAIGIVGVIAVPSIQGVVLGQGGAILNDLRKLIAPEEYRVYADKGVATSDTTEHPGGNLVDRLQDTYWEARDATPSITITFKETFDLGAIWVHNGTAVDYTSFRRPTKIALDFADGSVKELVLTDNHDAQRFELNVNGVREFTLRVLETTGDSGLPLAFGEIEFIGKR